MRQVTDDDMYASGWMKAKIIKCSNKDYWHIDSVGEIIKVRKVNWPSAYMEAKNGSSIPKSDIELINEKNTKD